jgi:hypothetical protein
MEIECSPPYNDMVSSLDGFKCRRLQGYIQGRYNAATTKLPLAAVGDENELDLADLTADRANDTSISAASLNASSATLSDLSSVSFEAFLVEARIRPPSRKETPTAIREKKLTYRELLSAKRANTAEGNEEEKPPGQAMRASDTPKDQPHESQERQDGLRGKNPDSGNVNLQTKQSQEHARSCYWMDCQLPRIKYPLLPDQLRWDEKPNS